MENDKGYFNLMGLGRLTRLAAGLEHLGCRAANSGVVIFAGDNGISRENISTYEPLSSNNIVRQH
ncbi:MAG: hypothetical protein ABFC94_02155, partial [Syntrophomonas sp.]